MKNNAISAIIGILAGLAIFLALQQRGCGDDRNIAGRIDTVVVVKIDTSRGQIVINNWQPKITVPAEAIPVVIDSAAVVRAYYAVNRYDTAFGDSAVSGTVAVTVSQNRITAFDLAWQGITRTTTQTVTIHPPVVGHLSVGVYAGGRDRFDWGPVGMWRDKSGRTFFGAYSMNDKSVRVGAALQIK